MLSPNPSTSLNSTPKIIYLDYLRILACLGVFACHVWAAGILPFEARHTESLKMLPPECLGLRAETFYQCGLSSIFLLPNDNWGQILFNSFNLLFGLGYQAVHLFFFLSGFGLTLSALLSEQKNSKIRWLNFLKKRFLRLYPSYWIVLTIYFALNFLYAYFALHYFYYKSFAETLGRYLQGAIFLNFIPVTWFIPVLLQLYLLFPLLFYFLKKFPLKRFLGLSLLVKIVSSAVIITVSMLAFGQIVGFALALAPGGVALTRLFEFCLGMAIAKVYVAQGCSISVFTYFRKPIIILLGFLLDGLGVFLSLKYTAINLNGHAIPIGLFISDALIGVGVFILSLNFVFLLQGLLTNVNSVYLMSMSNSTYEAYLLHGCFLNIFNLVFVDRVLVKTLKFPHNFFIICLLYLILLLIFAVFNLSFGYYLVNFKSSLLKKSAYFFNS